MILHFVSVMLIFSADAIRLNLNPKLSMCVNDTMSRVFSEDDTLLYIYHDRIDFFPRRKTSPQVVSTPNFDDKIASEYNRFRYNYVICFKTLTTLSSDLRQITKNLMMHNLRSHHAKFLLITPVKQVKSIFQLYWHTGIDNIVVLVYNAVGDSKLYTSNPQSPKNECGKKLNSFLTEIDCFSPEPIVLPKTLRPFSKCNLTYISYSTNRKLGIKSVEAVRFVLQILISHFGAGKISIVNPTQTDHKLTIFMFESRYLHKGNSMTRSYFIEDFVWIVPSPKLINPMVMLGLIFTPSVWLLVILAFFVVSVTWWLMAKHLKYSLEFSESLMRIFSITLFGCTNNYEMFWAIRHLFIAYVFYSIHIQTAFTSKLTEVLTVLQYEAGIKNMNDLANTNLTILVREDFYNVYFAHKETNDTLYNTIKKKLKVVDGDTMADYIFDKKTYQNYALLVQKNLMELSSKTLSFQPNYIVDNTFLLRLNSVFSGLKYAYVLKTIDKNIEKMKLCAVFVIVNFGAEALRPKQETIVTACVKNAIKQLFSEDDTLLYIHNGFKYVFPHTETNPQIVSNRPRQSTMIEYKDFKYSYNYVIQVTNFSSAGGIFNLVRSSSFWHKRQSLYGTFFLITAAANMLRPFFLTFWSLGIINIIVLVYDSLGNGRLYTSDPQAPENECGSKLNSFLTKITCSSKENIVLPKTYRKFHNCKLTYVSATARLRIGVKSVEAAWLVLDTFVMYLKTDNITLYDPTYKQPRFDIFTFKSVHVHKIEDNVTTASYFGEDLVWIVPSPKRVPPMKTLGLIFKNIVWSMIIVGFVSVTIAWWLILKHVNLFSDFTEILLRIFSITIFGGAHRYELFWGIRFLFISYVLYSIHIQTAFTSKLMEVLTAPQYERGIKNIHDLAKSNLSILVREDIYGVYFEHMESNDPLFKAVKSNIKTLTGDKMGGYIVNKTTYKKYAVLVQKNFMDIISESLHVQPNYIVENTFLATLHTAFMGMDNAYVLKTIDKVISILIESGVQEYFINNVKYRYKIKFIKAQVPIKLSLNHLYPIFVFWCSGLIISLFVFVLEFVSHKRSV
ncbi:hypothetical protein FQR65_LT01980 [Abscondita terminalis]|nr:hypothetical protein FQR65_LT01980 [Abscondita terminalis]